MLLYRPVVSYDHANNVPGAWGSIAMPNRWLPVSPADTQLDSPFVLLRTPASVAVYKISGDCGSTATDKVLTSACAAPTRRQSNANGPKIRRNAANRPMPCEGFITCPLFMACSVRITTLYVPCGGVPTPAFSVGLDTRRLAIGQP